MNDMCYVVKKGTAEGLLEQMNSIRVSIQFTWRKMDPRLLILDTHLQKKEDGTLDITEANRSPPTPTGA